MILALLFAGLAVAGTVARAVAAARLNAPPFPSGTLLVNVTGSFFLGLLAEASPEAVTVLGIAGLGSYTTFSTFAYEGVVMAEEGRGVYAVGYVVLTVVAGVGAAALGISLTT